jgi:hypothetical protein
LLIQKEKMLELAKNISSRQVTNLPLRGPGKEKKEALVRWAHQSQAEVEAMEIKRRRVEKTLVVKLDIRPNLELVSFLVFTWSFFCGDVSEVGELGVGSM